MLRTSFTRDRSLMPCDRDQLRVFTICEQRCTSCKSEAHHPRFHQRVEDIQPEDFSSAARRTWRRPAAEPTVQANNRANSFLNRSVPSGHPGLTKAAAKVLENHENVLGATVERMYKAQELRMEKLSSSGSAGSLAVGQFSGLHLGGHDTRENQTRDGRNGDPRRR